MKSRHFKGWMPVILILVAAMAFMGCVAERQSLKVTNMRNWYVEKAAPSVSFWRNQVGYPFPVCYTEAKDSRGVNWKIAYMDEYAGTDPDPKVLVLIHGKGVFGAYFGHVMKMALENGLRVIVPDLPNYGKPIPGNLDNPVARTLDDTREALHEVIANQLGVKKATYLGHSLGGQWVMGYALKYPEAVEKIILESPGGIEEFPTKMKFGKIEVPLFDPSYLRNLEVWEKVWSRNLKGEFAKDEQAIRDFYYFKKRDPKTGEVTESNLGYFKKNNSYANFVTRVRVEMIDGNQSEYERYIYTYIRDIYSLGVEVRKEDPQSLVKQKTKIKAPILLLFGKEEPFIPTTVFSGKKNLRWDIIRPFYNDMKQAGNPPVVKLYPGCGHFPHTDKPDEFSADAVDFVYEGKVKNPENVETYKKP